MGQSGPLGRPPDGAVEVYPPDPTSALGNFDAVQRRCGVAPSKGFKKGLFGGKDRGEPVRCRIRRRGRAAKARLTLGKNPVDVRLAMDLEGATDLEDVHHVDPDATAPRDRSTQSLRTHGR